MSRRSNTVHNNAVFEPPNGNPVSVAWRGTTYDFIPGGLAAFLSWDFYEFMAMDLITLNEDLMTAPEVAALASA